jgi:hypothetical protein
LTPGPAHDHRLMDRLVEALQDVWHELAIRPMLSVHLTNGFNDHRGRQRPMLPSEQVHLLQGI